MREVERIDTIAFIAIVIVGTLLFYAWFIFPLFGIQQGRTPPYCQYGDINGDGRIEPAETLKYTPTFWWQLERADVNNLSLIHI